ncbi:MAG: hypothetical protein KAI29_14005 [Cyclobacteriaceae bacterium]|nr:hypothetical protein [Cyclobacteriaceae bacterium]
MNHLLILFLLGFAWSCGPVKNKKTETASTFFDIAGLIDNQVQLLDSIGPSLLKKAIIDGVEENTHFTPSDDDVWAKELMIFKSADINKPTLADIYETKETRISGSKIIIYKSKYPETTQVDSLAISFSTSKNKPLTIHARLVSSNTLFESEKTLELAFKAVSGQIILSKYKIEGWQKMISKDSTIYFIEGVLDF